LPGANTLAYFAAPSVTNKKRFIAPTPGVVLRSVPLAGGSDDDDADGADGSAGRNGEGGGDGAGGVGGEAQTKSLKLV
jgi:hypothetical protein